MQAKYIYLLICVLYIMLTFGEPIDYTHVIYLSIGLAYFAMAEFAEHFRRVY